MSIKTFLKNNKLTSRLYKKLKDRRFYKKNIAVKHEFINRSGGKEKLCIVLAGYKEFLYDSVFGRIKAALTDDIDVCVISSGKFSDKLKDLCEKDGWSYLSTKRNNVCLAQNSAIYLHPKAKYIYKIDEDIFVCKDYFKKIFNAYEFSLNSEYRTGFIAPLININGYSHLCILEKLNLKQVYAEKFEQPLYAAGSDRMIESNPNVAKFMWGEGNIVPSIDEMDKLFGQEEIALSACPIRFSIGAIFFTRDEFDRMCYFRVGKGSDMGADEAQVCSYCVVESRAMLISENTVVGHLSFGPQNVEMKNFYFNNREKF